MTVVDDLGNAIGGATVNGSYNESASGVSNGSGAVTLTTGATAKGVVAFMFCVDSISSVSGLE